jgi:ABC-type bacteriocin/lantibiotic exporter with double-glycine peptidase domain
MKLKVYILKFAKLLALNRDYVAYLGKRRMLYFVFLAIVTSLLNSFNYVALIPLVSLVIDGDQSSLSNSLSFFGPIKELIPASFENAIYWIGAAIIITFLLKMIFNVLFSHLAGLYGEGYLLNVRLRMIKKADLKAYEGGVQSSSQVLHYNNMITRIGSFNWAVFSLVSKLLSSLFLFFSLLLVSAKLATFAVIFVVVWGFLLLPVLKSTREIAERYTEILRKIQQYLIEEIEAREIIKIFGLGNVRKHQLKALSAEAVKSNAYLSDIRAFVGNLQEFLVVIVGVVILCVANHYHLEIGYIVAYGYVFSKFLGSMNEASNYLNTGLEVLPPSEEILKYVKDITPELTTVASNAERIETLEYNDLSFSWGAQHLFSIPKIYLQRGDRLLIRGINGKGKSTLLKLMAGLIKTEGTVKLNQSKNLKVVELACLYERLSYLPQTAVVFNGLLSENILLNSGKTLTDIEDLVSKIGINLNDYFPNWTNYQVVESGKSLSGGEIQLIAFLRALVRDYDVLFVDEFANHLSPKLMKQFDLYLASIQNQIIVCVSHAPVSFFNREFVLEDGKLNQVVRT